MSRKIEIRSEQLRFDDADVSFTMAVRYFDLTHAHREKKLYRFFWREKFFI